MSKQTAYIIILVTTRHAHSFTAP